MSSQPVVETIEAHDCSIVLRRMEGPLATELYFLGQPPSGAEEAGDQAEAVYRAILGVLGAEGAGFEAVVSETIFLRRLAADLTPVREARTRVLAAADAAAHRPATTEIEQPPLNPGACLEVAIQAVLPHAGALHSEPVAGAETHALRFSLGGEDRLYAAGLHGSGAGAREQTRAMFAAAEALLSQAGMSFRDVVRTWIHLREMDRDYADLNLARRAFFEARGIDPAPASTGIGGAPVSEDHDLCLGFLALRPVSAGGSLSRSVMTAPTLNEAGLYGSDFARGTRLEESNKVALHVSGTASIDEAGRTVHPGDFDAQVDRMLVNVAALLEGQGAGFGDVVSAVTYLKHAADAPRLREKLRQAGYEGFPNVLVEAPVCRPDLLCETEALAVLPVRA